VLSRTADSALVEPNLLAQISADVPSLKTCEFPEHNSICCHATVCVSIDVVPQSQTSSRRACVSTAPQFIREAFERYSTGLHRRQELLEWINDKGLRTWQGKRLSTQTFRRMFVNPLCAGRIVVQGARDGAGQDWRIVEKGSFQPIVTEELFDKVQLLMSGRRPLVAPRRRANSDFPLRHFVRCGSCDKPLTGSKSTSQTGQKYAYYHCQNKKCPSAVRASNERLESGFRTYVQQLRPNSAYLTIFRESVIVAYETKFAESLELRGKLERELREKRESKRKLNEAFIYRNAIGEEDYHQMKEALE
jgi:site-specific DNA recombinase